MILLQVDSTTERFFETSPDTVFGLLVGALVLAVVALWVTYTLSTRTYTAKLVELNLTVVGTLKDLSHNLERLRDAGVNMTEDLRTDITNTRDHIASKLVDIENHLRYGQQTNKNKKTDT